MQLSARPAAPAGYQYAASPNQYGASPNQYGQLPRQIPGSNNVLAMNQVRRAPPGAVGVPSGAQSPRGAPAPRFMLAQPVDRQSLGMAASSSVPTIPSVAAAAPVAVPTAATFPDIAGGPLTLSSPPVPVQAAPIVASGAPTIVQAVANPAGSALLSQPAAVKAGSALLPQPTAVKKKKAVTMNLADEIIPYQCTTVTLWSSQTIPATQPEPALGVPAVAAPVVAAPPGMMPQMVAAPFTTPTGALGMGGQVPYANYGRGQPGYANMGNFGGMAMSPGQPMGRAIQAGTGMMV
jgi:hypothetical protein